MVSHGLSCSVAHGISPDQELNLCPLHLQEDSLPAIWEAWVQSLGQEDPLEKGMATHSRILAWRIRWTEEPDGLQCMESQRVGFLLLAV